MVVLETRNRDPTAGHQNMGDSEQQDFSSELSNCGVFREGDAPEGGGWVRIEKGGPLREV